MSERATDCDCTGDEGFCNRHGIFKTAAKVQLCRARPGYFAAWEGGYGIGQPAYGLGNKVAKGIAVVTRGRVKPCGGCNRRREKLNELMPGKPPQSADE